MIESAADLSPQADPSGVRTPLVIVTRLAHTQANYDFQGDSRCL